ncbi:hypothetical protein, partial [Nocardioides sp. YIM 152588]|uniref:hypothetical protein n=1 Tax=Nocardioides sp. YIM 152588 TaxID=3158259 RepID=UPI0032E39BE2
LLVGALLLGAPAAVLAAPGTASAVRVDGCGDLDLTDQEAVTARAEGVDNVFAGEIVEREVVRASGEKLGWRYTIEVGAGFTGLVSSDSRVRLTVPNEDGRLLSARLPKGASYLFFATEDGSQLVADPCLGVVRLKGGLTTALTDRLDEYLSPPAPVVPTPTLTRDADTDEESPALGRLVAPGAALALVGVLGLVLVSRLGRERR